MQIDERRRGDVSVLDLHGKIAGGDGEALLKNAVTNLAKQGVRKVVLNFADVSYMDSVGVSTIVRSHLTLRKDGGQLKLLNLPRHIAHLLTVTRLTSVFDTFDDESDAVRSFDRTAPQA